MQRREIRHLPVAALVQAHAGGIKEHLAPVLHDGKAELIRRARLREPAEAVLLAQPRDRRLFDDGLTVRNGMQLAVQAVALDRERAVLRNKILQRDGLDALKQLLKALGLEGVEQDHDPLTHAAAEIRLGHRHKIAVKKDAPVLHADVLEIEPLQLIADKALQSEQARHAKCHIFHTTMLHKKRYYVKYSG